MFSNFIIKKMHVIILLQIEWNKYHKNPQNPYRNPQNLNTAPFLSIPLLFLDAVMGCLKAVSMGGLSS